MDQVNPEKKYVVVSNPNAASEVQESTMTFSDEDSTPGPVVRENFVMKGYREVHKAAPTKVHNIIAFVALILLVVVLFLGVIALSIAFALEIPKLKSETDSDVQQSSISALTNSAAEQQSSVSALMDRLNSLNSSMDRLSQQLLQAIDSQTQQVASSLIQQVNSSLELLSQQLLQDISDIDNKTQQINSSLGFFSQQLLQDISTINDRVEQVNSSQQTLSQQLLQDISAINIRVEQVNSSQQMLSQQLQQDISLVNSRTQAINSSLSQDISVIDSRVEQVNSSQQMLSLQLLQDISAVNSRTQEINSSLTQQLLQDISSINTRVEQVNSSQQMFSQQLLQDISAVDSRVEQVNSSQQMLSQQLQQDISLVDSKTQAINSSLSQDIAAIDSKVEQVNSSQQMLSQQLQQDISLVDSRTQAINSSLSQDISAIDSRVEQVNSSQQMLSLQLLQDISVIDSRTQEINSSQQILSQQLQQDILAINNRIEQVNISLLQQVNEVQTQAQETVDGLEALGELPTFPASSCAAILSSLPSGFYYLRASNGSAVRVYCDMTLSCGGVTGGWARVVDVDFNDSSNVCPSGFREDIDADIRTCITNSTSGGCYSIDFSTSDITYSSVCGKVIAYQLGTPEAFSRFIVISSLGISSQYLDGISLTHGNPMQHVWSFAVGVTESRTDRFGCPCNTGSTISVMNTFIGTDYFCDSAASSISSGARYPDNPLFDGVGCAATSECCSFNNPPWFYKQLLQSTTDDLEMRVCRDESGTNENILVQSIELYVR